MTPPADCRRCGVCCFSASPTFVRVSGDDWARLGADAERLAHFVGHRAFMRMSGGHCAALDLRHTPEGAPDDFCTVYEYRPQVCRDLARGSPSCLGELDLKAAGRPAEAIALASAPVSPTVARVSCAAFQT